MAKRKRKTTVNKKGSNTAHVSEKAKPKKQSDRNSSPRQRKAKPRSTDSGESSREKTHDRSQSIKQSNRLVESQQVREEGSRKAGSQTQNLKKPPISPTQAAPSSPYQGPRDGQSAGQTPLRRDRQNHNKRLSIIQKILIAGIVVTAVMLLYLMFKPLSKAVVSATKTGDLTSFVEERIPADNQPSVPEQPVGTSAAVVQPHSQKAEDAVSPTEALSLRIAETFYQQKEFNKAYAVYNRLRQNLTAPSRGPRESEAKEDPLKDFLQLKMALCMKNAGDAEQADRLFRAVSQSYFPLARITANYHQSIDLMQQKQYLNAQTKIYQTIALIDAVDWPTPDGVGNHLDSDVASRLVRDCHFIAAECLTKEILSLRDADKAFPPHLWSHNVEFDPFANLTEAQLRRLLSSGSRQLNKALLAPHIQSIGDEQGQSLVPRWEISCCGASVEELLARFAANADLDINWACESAAYLRGDKPAPVETAGLRNRPVNLYMSAATAQQLVTVAAGCAGLLARFDDDGTVTIFNPSNYASLSEHIALLSRQAISLWQKYLLTFSDGECIPNAHFALGLLQAQRGHTTDAIAEYKLTANRYPRTPLAPFALLNSSKLKVNLLDYSGAREDLKQLTEQYPNSELSDQAILFLADATMKAGLLQEAARLYRKVYHLGLSLESQRASALGAGRCFYEEKDYENAAKWLIRYINIAEDPKGRDFCLACFYLGKAYLALGKHQQACDAFQHALMEQLPTQEYVETISALVKVHVQQGDFIEALKILENIRSQQLSQTESIEMTLLKARVLRSMGLVDKAVAILGDVAQYLPDSQLKAKVSFEQAKCSVAKGNLESARKNLSEILVFVEPGYLAHEVGYELANVCLKLSENAQAISICLQLLARSKPWTGPSPPSAGEPEAALKQKTLELLATAYAREKKYNKAALALLGQWSKDDVR